MTCNVRQVRVGSRLTFADNFNLSLPVIIPRQLDSIDSGGYRMSSQNTSSNRIFFDKPNLEATKP